MNCHDSIKLSLFYILVNVVAISRYEYHVTPIIIQLRSRMRLFKDPFVTLFIVTHRLMQHRFWSLLKKNHIAQWALPG